MSEWQPIIRCPDFDNYEHVWISDGKVFYIVDEHEFECWDNESIKNYKYWLPIEKPELPKPNLHHCRENRIDAFEDEDGFWVQVVGHLATEPNSNPAWRIKYCPHCGYKPSDSNEINLSS